MKLSCVVPCYNEEACLPLFLEAFGCTAADLVAAYPDLSIELILVDDGSSDGTLTVIKRIAAAVARLARTPAPDAQRFWEALLEGGDALLNAFRTVENHCAQTARAVPEDAVCASGDKNAAPGDKSAAPAPASLPVAEPSRTGYFPALRPLPFTLRWLSFSRNFGKEAALLAGLEAADGDLVATMDADLQDPPALLFTMYDMLFQENVDSVACRRVTRAGEPAIRSLCARAFYRLINHISPTSIADGARDFRLMRRPFVDALLSLPEYNRFTKGLFGWVGFTMAWLPYENAQRAAGETKWSFFKLVRYAFEGIVSVSTAPLALASYAGILLCFAALVATAFIVVRTLLFGDPVSGWPSLACIIMFIGGLQLMCLGIIGQYLAKTYLEVKRRPHYIVRERSDGAQELGCQGSAR